MQQKLSYRYGTLWYRSTFYCSWSRKFFFGSIFFFFFFSMKFLCFIEKLEVEWYDGIKGSGMCLLQWVQGVFGMLPSHGSSAMWRWHGSICKGVPWQNVDLASEGKYLPLPLCWISLLPQSDAQPPLCTIAYLGKLLPFQIIVYEIPIIRIKY